MNVTLAQFFNAVLPFATSEECMELRAKDASEAIVGRKFFALDPYQPDTDGDDAVARFVMHHVAQRHDLYFGCASRVEKGGELKGDTGHCKTTYCLWTDHDFKTTGEDLVRAMLAVVPDPPSIVIHSGGGLHSYWLLAKPIPADPALARWLRDLAFTLRADRGAALVTQILRVPGTTNWKKPELYPAGRPVVIETFEPDRKLVLPC